MERSRRMPSAEPQAALPLEWDGDREPTPEPDCPHARAGKLPKPRPRIISASKRTDIPAFYLGWMRERVKAGWVDVPNPMFRRARDELKRLTHVSLRPEDVIAVVWWSKNYAVYERMHEAFSCYRRQFFHFTINPRREDLAWLEPDVPPVEEALRQAGFLVGLAGAAMVAWRYDPIMFWREGGADRSSWDRDFFESMCRELAKLGVRRCYTSLADRYLKFEQRIKRFFPHITLRDPEDSEVAVLAQEMAQVAAGYGMQVFSCTEAALARCAGFRKGSCIDGPLLGGRTKRLATDQKMRGREECACTLHADIGDYVTQECGYSCVYCYANPNHRRFGARRAGSVRQTPSSEEGPLDAAS